ncbi:uncharacterized protein LOC117169981 [Belonocnema kinseyi]|uniref:uncharacterized protein LOC117169981 n=1 Tax=Belonocnema kinseyi TaxID=2817044 RepID=UPI00143CC5E7|nr:uncharacterized protein LOC117169981 [Belonocnema kinseyi]
MCQLKKIQRIWRRIWRNSEAAFLTASEIVDARFAVIRMIQAQHSSSEISLLNSEGILLKGNLLRKLKPFVRKNPPILPYSSALSRTFVCYGHLSSRLGGPILKLSFLLRHTWILGRSRLVKLEVRNCLTCQRAEPRLASQLMGNLPKDRVTPSRSFNISGLNYAGPIQVRKTKGSRHRSYKGYIALFVCFATRATHLEVVSDLTTTCFLVAFHRFIGRRGICRRL